MYSFKGKKRVWQRARASVPHEPIKKGRAIDHQWRWRREKERFVCAHISSSSSSDSSGGGPQQP